MATGDAEDHRPRLVAWPRTPRCARAPGGVAWADQFGWWCPVFPDRALWVARPDAGVLGSDPDTLLLADAVEHVRIGTQHVTWLAAERGAAGPWPLGSRARKRFHDPHHPVSWWCDGGFLYAQGPRGVRCIGPGGPTDRLVPLGDRLLARVVDSEVVAVGGSPRMHALSVPLRFDLGLQRVGSHRLVGWAAPCRPAQVDLRTGDVRFRSHLPLGGGLRLDPNDLEITDRLDRVVVAARPPRPHLAGDRVIGIRGGVLELATGRVSHEGLLRGDLCGNSSGHLFWIDGAGRGAWVHPRREPLRVPLEQDEVAVSIRDVAGLAHVVTNRQRAWRIAPGVEPRRVLSPPDEPMSAVPGAWHTMGFTHAVRQGARWTLWADDGRCVRVPTRR